ncbi:hypothetical protein [Agromyces sp. NPDC057865]|uniref:hypothetical protein n=1 Tax=Agromyces sp. NPDC057865 TaxID=3346267 RepID=UPI003671CC00
MTDWQPLSVRRGLRAPIGLSEEISPQLTRSLAYWVESAFGYRSRAGTNESLLLSIGVMAGIDLNRSATRTEMLTDLVSRAESDDDVMLDVLDALLHKGRYNESPENLRMILMEGNSAWTVSHDGQALERRVDATASNVFERALSVEETASLELAEAWTKVYGTNPDASDAWDHAIKAVEEVLIPVVVPAKAKANLGSVAGELKAHPDRFVLRLSPEGATQSSSTLEGMLRLIWPNPDRHGAGERRTPTLDEAGTVVGIAVLIVQWARDGVVQRA